MENVQRIHVCYYSYHFLWGFFLFWKKSKNPENPACFLGVNFSGLSGISRKLASMIPVGTSPLGWIHRSSLGERQAGPASVAAKSACSWRSMQPGSWRFPTYKMEETGPIREVESKLCCQSLIFVYDPWPWTFNHLVLGGPHKHCSVWLRPVMAIS